LSMDNNDNNGGRNGNNQGPNPNFNFKNNRFALIFLIAILGMFLVMLFGNNQQATNQIPYSQFLGYLSNGEVESVRIMDQYEIQVANGRSGVRIHSLSRYSSNTSRPG